MSYNLKFKHIFILNILYGYIMYKVLVWVGLVKDVQ